MGRGGGSECTAYVELDSLLGLECGGALPNVPSAVSLYLVSIGHFQPFFNQFLWVQSSIVKFCWSCTSFEPFGSKGSASLGH